jgi:hypothetical protein
MANCDQSGARTFCMHHLQDAFDALEALKLKYPDPVSAVGFYTDSLLAAVGDVVHDVEAACQRMEIPVDEAAQTLFIDGLMMGVLLAARAPENHARHALAEFSAR